MGRNVIFWIGSVFYAIILGSDATDLLLNNNFESINYHGNWYCAGGCSLTANSDSYEGSHSVQVSNR